MRSQVYTSNSMHSTYDAIAIGSGHNALVTAAYLAQAGWKVLVLEQSDRPGGWVRTEEVTLPGFHHDLYASTLPLWLLSAPHAELGADLAKRGLNFVTPSIATGVSIPHQTPAVFYPDLQANLAELDHHAPGDGEAWATMLSEFGQVAPIFGNLSNTDLSTSEAEALFNALLMAPDGNGPSDYTIAYGKSAIRFLRERFQSETTQAMFAAWMMHLGRGPDDARGAFFLPLVLSSLQMVGTPLAIGGAERLVQALVQLIEDHGGTVLCGHSVEQILVEQGQAKGVRSCTGELFSAKRAVVAGINPDQLYLRLLTESGLSSTLRRQQGHHRYSYGVMQIHVALSTMPKWQHPRLEGAGQIHLTPGLDNISQSVHQAIQGFLPSQPTISVDIPSYHDLSRAPEGQAVMRIQATEVPVQVQGDAADHIAVNTGQWTSDLKNRFADRLIDIVGQHLPNVPDAILERYIVSPSELAASNPNAGPGAITHVAQDITEYAFWRPSHQTVIPNLYQVGAATWPGHGVGGASGYIVAQRLLQQFAA